MTLDSYNASLHVFHPPIPLHPLSPPPLLPARLSLTKPTIGGGGGGGGEGMSSLYEETQDPKTGNQDGLCLLGRDCQVGSRARDGGVVGGGGGSGMLSSKDLKSRGLGHLVLRSSGSVAAPPRA